MKKILINGPIPAPTSNGRRKAANIGTAARRTSAYLLVFILIAGLVSPTLALQINATTDGYLTRMVALGATQYNLRNGAGTSANNDPAALITIGDLLANSSLADNYTYQKRGMISFNYSEIEKIPKNYTITSAVVSVYVHSKGNGLGSFNYTIVDASPSSDMSYIASDYQTTTFTQLSDIIPYASIGTAGTLVNFTLTTEGINRLTQAVQDNTSFSVMFSSDIDVLNTSVTWVSAGDSYFFARSLASVEVPAQFITLNAGYIPPYSGVDDYGFGDSITRATGYDALNVTGFDCYVLNMTRRYNATATADHNMDGGGQPSWWMLNNWATHPGSPYPKNYFVMAHINDRALNASYDANQSADNLIGVAVNATAAGSKVYIILEPPWPNSGTSSSWQNWNNQYDNITRMETRLASRGYSYIKGYDSMDSIQGNGIFDTINLTTQDSSGHPNVLGHSLLADYVWNYISSSPITTQSAPTGPVSLTYLNGQAFTDTSTGSPTAWNWSFGDGSYQLTQNPYHFWKMPGVYKVELNASNFLTYNKSSTYVVVLPKFR